MFLADTAGRKGRPAARGRERRPALQEQQRAVADAAQKARVTKRQREREKDRERGEERRRQKPNALYYLRIHTDRRRTGTCSGVAHSATWSDQEEHRSTMHRYICTLTHHLRVGYTRVRACVHAWVHARDHHGHVLHIICARSHTHTYTLYPSFFLPCSHLTDHAEGTRDEMSRLTRDKNPPAGKIAIFWKTSRCSLRKTILAARTHLRFLSIFLSISLSLHRPRRRDSNDAKAIDSTHSRKNREDRAEPRFRPPPPSCFAACGNHPRNTHTHTLHLRSHTTPL